MLVILVFFIVLHDFVDVCCYRDLSSHPIKMFHRIISKILNNAAENYRPISLINNEKYISST